ncbi:hypothetical protein NVP1084O_220 [Vibrio phage 1.084.O._10N.261.49.F5]|nr:hypothetical protein NVP1084O_220 [Vibrio phage 1.084.O._10N.261.49.F5]
MTTTTTATYATVILSDTDKNLNDQFRMIGKFEDVFIPEGEAKEMTILKLAIDGAVKEKLEAHNKKRVEQVNQTTLERTGKRVNLQPIGIESVQITIKG